MGGEHIIDLAVLDGIVHGDGVYHPQRCKQAGPMELRNTRIHLVLLNWELMPGSTLLKFLRAATTITCADGGGNQLLDRLWQFDLPTIADVFHFQMSGEKKKLYLVGDLDSLAKDKKTETETKTKTKNGAEEHPAGLYVGENKTKKLKSEHTKTEISGNLKEPSKLLKKKMSFGVKKEDYSIEMDEGEAERENFLDEELDSKHFDKLSGLQKQLDIALKDFGFEIHQMPEQNTTDFEKVLKFMRENNVVEEGDTILVDGCHGGRFDHTIANVAALFKNEELNRRATIIMISQLSVTALLARGINIIKPALISCSTVCGILPFKDVESVTTRGLKWDLDQQKMSIDGLISSSNEREDEQLVIETSGPLLFYSELHRLEEH